MSHKSQPSQADYWGYPRWVAPLLLPIALTGKAPWSMLKQQASKSETKVSKLLKRGVIFLVILLALVALFFAFFPSSEEVKSGSLDELVELTVTGSVELADGTVEGNIDRIVQEGDTLTAMEGDTQIFKVSFVGSTAELYDYLVAREVDMSKVALDPQPPSGFNWGNLLLTLLPLVLFIGVIWFIFRRIKRINPIQEKIETIKKLAELKEAGVITEEEFEAKKSALLEQL